MNTEPPYHTVVSSRALLDLAHRWDGYEPRDLSHHAQGVCDGFSMAAAMLRELVERRTPGNAPMSCCDPLDNPPRSPDYNEDQT